MNCPFLKYTHKFVLFLGYAEFVFFSSDIGWYLLDLLNDATHCGSHSFSKTFWAMVPILQYCLLRSLDIVQQHYLYETVATRSGP